MKKRAMKKWIPKNTPYCYEIISVDEHKDKPWVVHTKQCKWLKYLGTNLVTGEYNNKTYAETMHVYRCEYLKYTDYEEDSLLWDRCKECGEHDDFKRFKRRRYGIGRKTARTKRTVL